MTGRTVLARATFPAALLLLLGTTSTACSDDGGDRDAFCATAQRFAADNPAAAFARYDPNDPAAAAALLRDAADRLGGWADEAPGDVDGDVQALADAAASLADQFEALGGGAGATDVPALDTAVVEAASTNVLQFTRDECGVELDTGAP